MNDDPNYILKVLKFLKGCCVVLVVLLAIVLYSLYHN